MGLSLSEMRRQMRVERDPQQLVRWRRVLRADSRGGAKPLLEWCEKQIESARAERERIEALLALRARLRAQGLRFVAGVDEVGVGPLAGPVVAAAVVLPDQVDLPGLDDSKQLRRRTRERLAREVREQAEGCAIGSASPAEIDELNIYHAALLAMRRAVENLRRRVAPDYVLVDARRIPGIRTRQQAIVGGDANDASIAAASIVAKVYRDAMMRRLDAEHPGYGLGRHMGYATAQHLAALRRLGPSPIHRRSFAPVAESERS